MPVANIKGLVRMGFVRARAIDVPTAVIPTVAEATVLANEIARYWQDASKGALQIAVNVHAVEVALPLPAAMLASVRRNVIADAIAQAALTDTNLREPDVWVGFVNTTCDSGATGNRVIAGSFQEVGQRGWKWCLKCQSLAFWDQTGQPGPCAAGGTHDHSRSASYVARFAGQGPGEAGWRWCRKCACLARPAGSPGPCPGGGSHDHGASGAYVVATAATPATQGQWSRCNRCTVIVSTGNPAAACAAGGVHQTAGAYFVGFDQFPALGFLLHESGHALGLDHSFNDSPNPLDARDDGRPGAYGDQWDIMSYSRTASHKSAQFVDGGPGLAAPTLYKNGWIGPERVAFIRQPGDVELVSNSESIADGFLTAVVGMPSSATVYSLEYRTPHNWDQAVIGGVLIREHWAAADTPSLGLLAQNAWRWCSLCGSLVYRGQQACAGGREHHSDGSSLALPIGNVPAGAQTGWRWCSQCQSLVQEQGGAGICAAGGSHNTSTSGAYAVLAATTANPPWLWCQRCKALFQSTPDVGRCPAGGQHDGSRSMHYQVASSGAGTQDMWSVCSRCRSVFYTRTGACPAGRAHDTSQSGDYFIVHDILWAPGQSGWRWCSKCYGLGFLDDTRGPGTCAAGGRHDHNGSGVYHVEFVKAHAAAIPQEWIDQVEQVGWAWCHRCEMLGYSSAPSRCPVGGAHDFAQSAAYRLRYAVSGNGDEGHLQQSRSWKVGEKFASADGLFTVDVLAIHEQPARVSVRIGPPRVIRPVNAVNPPG
jgi:hypothetical protein